MDLKLSANVKTRLSLYVIPFKKGKFVIKGLKWNLVGALGKH